MKNIKITLVIFLMISLTGCHSIKQKDEDLLSKQQLKELIEGTIREANSWALFSGAGYLDFDNYFVDGYDYYYLIKNDEVKSLDDINEILEKYYSSKVISQVSENIRVIEKDNQLYSAVYGIGGVGAEISKVEAKKEEESYLVTISINKIDFETGEILNEVFEEKTYRVLRINDKWLFDDLFDSYFDYLDENTEFEIIND